MVDGWRNLTWQRLATIVDLSNSETACKEEKSISTKQIDTNCLQNT